ncbi:hypothetical protein K437DRAFT_259709 [Tilletiaria anomala UBC 951]|uniref:Paf1-domain-containing protein n=1 Tax=Tilletiaria anomala (strain ATCC 24038 / CBS 436.72 / UBC 951) TaxID=1037660 RepID=A0A066VFV8_TILAU|nr:uncharacterized protein K437DRAFT_259709 [Tilletiaria anomala UBC 951]KDN37654.1 hypothetical protein K437DRAFT_259709 [Tilletiaria anomala UBC 951]
MSASGRKSRDLIERVRYPNPIPLPPYPPKLTKVETPSSRYADGPETQGNVGGNAGLRFTSRLAQANSLPVVVDAEEGMPLDLNLFSGAWTGNLKAVAPHDLISAEALNLDPEDEFLLGAIARTTVGGSSPSQHVGSYATTGVNGAVRSSQAGLGPSVAPRASAAGVTWLRRTEYLGMEQIRSGTRKEKRPRKLSIDTSREAQIDRINRTFAKIKTQPLSELKHPTKGNLRAVQSWDLLPDAETWSTNFQIVRFQDWPGRVKDGKPIADPRVSSALLRPVHTDLNEQRISFYLITPEDEDSVTAAAAADAKAGDTGDGASAADQDGEDEELFGDDEETAAPKKRKRDDAVAKEASIEENITKSHQNVEQEIAERYEKKRRTGHVTPQPEQEGEEPSADDYTSFKFHRDYQPGEQDAAQASSQYVFVFDDSSGIPPQSDPERAWRAEQRAGLGGDDAAKAATKGKQSQRQIAYWHPIAMRYTLRQKRIRRNESRRYGGMWDRIRLAEREPLEKEIKKRWRQRRLVDHLDARLEAVLDESEGEMEDAEGEVEEGAATHDALHTDTHADTTVRDRHEPDGDASMEDAGVAAKDKVAGNKDSGSDRSDGDDGDDDDDDDDSESIDADEELKALAEEAEGQQDDTPVEGRRRRSAAAAAANSGPSDGDADADDDEE